MDTILQLDEVINFKTAIEAAVEAQQRAASKAAWQRDGGAHHQHHQHQQHQHQHQHPQQQQQQAEEPSQTGSAPNNNTSSNCPRYVTELLSKVTPDLVQSLLTWTAADWIVEFAKGYQQIPMLLDILARHAEQQQGSQPTYVTAAQQQLDAVSTLWGRGGGGGNAPVGNGRTRGFPRRGGRGGMFQVFSLPWVPSLAGTGAFFKQRASHHVESI